MPVSRRTHEELQSRYEKAIYDRDEACQELAAARYSAGRIAHELATAKDVIASHIVAAGHPSTVLHSPQAFAEALRVALADAGVDLRIELARLEGAEL
jgi:hypothetical protein